MSRGSILVKETPSQTAGPYVQMGLTPNFVGICNIYNEDLGLKMISDDIEGEQITVEGRIFDGMGTPLKDAVVEIWQANAAGFYPNPVELIGQPGSDFSGWGRRAVDPISGVFSFLTIKPGRVPFWDGSLMAPHITLWIVARGINLGLHTRIYFGDEVEANKDDPVLKQVEHQERLSTLIAQRNESVYNFDVRLQGSAETIFFDI